MAKIDEQVEQLSPAEIRALKALLSSKEIQDILRRHDLRMGKGNDKVITDLREAIEDAGGIEGFCKTCGIHPSSVTSWLRGHSGISPGLQEKIIVMTNGRYKADEFKEVSKRNFYRNYLK